MSHLSDDDLVLHYYREDGPAMVAAEHHLRSCAQCARAFDALSRTLNAVVVPEFVEAPDDTPVLRHLLREQRRGAPRAASPTLPVPRGELGTVVLAWLAPVLYPLSLPALFASASWAREQGAATAFAVLTLLWACAGPLVAVAVLHRIADRFDRPSTRLRAVGALMAAISAPLFLLVSRPGLGLWPWYGSLVVAALVALLPWPTTARATGRFLPVHRLAALVLGLFVLGHIINQAIAFVSVSSYAAMRSVMRLASQQPVSYAVIVSAVAIQMATGAAMGMNRVRAGAFARNLQVVSGWYLAVFLLSHVFSGFLFSPPAGATRVAASISPLNLLANVQAAAALPYYLLGVASFLFHVGVYARLAALAYLAEVSVRRLSYAAALAATMIVVTVGLGLCGIHLFG